MFVLSHRNDANYQYVCDGTSMDINATHKGWSYMNIISFRITLVVFFCSFPLMPGVLGMTKVLLLVNQFFLL